MMGRRMAMGVVLALAMGAVSSRTEVRGAETKTPDAKIIVAGPFKFAPTARILAASAPRRASSARPSNKPRSIIRRKAGSSWSWADSAKRFRSAASRCRFGTSRSEGGAVAGRSAAFESGVVPPQSKTGELARYNGGLAWVTGRMRLCTA